MKKQERYKDNNGDDWIDEFARTKSVQEFRGAMSFVIGKYNRRVGKKDLPELEVRKMADYSNRWLEYEVELAEGANPHEINVEMRGLVKPNAEVKPKPNDKESDRSQG